MIAAIFLGCQDAPARPIEVANPCVIEGGYSIDGVDELATACDLPCDPTDVRGTLRVTCRHQIDDLSALSCFRDVHILDIGQCRRITNLDGLGGLRRVGSLRLDLDADREDLSGLDSLEAIGNELYGFDLQSLRSLEGLGSVTEFGVSAGQGTVSLNDVPALESLAGIEELLAPEVERPDGGFRFFLGDAPLLVDLSALSGVGETPFLWWITELDTLTSLAGLHASTIGTFLLSWKVPLAKFDAPDLVEIGQLVLENESIQTLHGLAGVKVGGVYARGISVASLSGPDYRATLDGLELEWNDPLLDLDGFEGVTAIDGRLLIASNSGLTSLDGLKNLRSVRCDVIISDNPQLSHDEIVAFIEAIGPEHVGGKLHIWNNGG